MKTILSAIAVLLAACCADGQSLSPSNRVSVTLAWDLSPDESVLGYHVYYGVASRAYTNLVTATPRTNCLATIDGIVPGVRYFFAATCFNALLESDFSPEISWTAPPPLTPPTGLATTNVAVKVLLQSAPTPGGPWSDLATLGTGVSSPAFYRSKVSIEIAAAARISTLVKRRIVSPKASSR